MMHTSSAASNTKPRVVSPQSRLGDIGERLVSLYENCRLSDDPFDQFCDMVDRGGKNVEVKTQNRFAKLDVFSIRRSGNSIVKCMSVERLIFVEYDITDVIKIWECIDRESFIDYSTATGLAMRGWRCSALKLLHELTDPKLSDEMRRLSKAFEFREYCQML